MMLNSGRFVTVQDTEYQGATLEGAKWADQVELTFKYLDLKRQLDGWS